MKNIYPHFKPDKNLPKELDTIRTAAHSTYNINYHLVWIPKYRRTLLADPKVKRILAEIIEGQCEDHKWKKLALEVMPELQVHQARKLFFGKKSYYQKKREGMVTESIIIERHYDVMECRKLFNTPKDELFLGDVEWNKQLNKLCVRTIKT